MAEPLIARASAAIAAGDEAGATSAIAAALAAPGLAGNEARQLVHLARGIDRNDLALTAARREPANFDTEMMMMQLRLELGEQIADQIALLIGDEPRAGPPLLQLIGALQAEGRISEAIVRLERAIGAAPDWIAGHQTLSQLKWQSGAGHEAHLGFAAAASRLPNHEVLWAAWLGTLKSMADWPSFESVAVAARRQFPSSALVAMVCADGFSELGKSAEADNLFAALSLVQDPQFDGARLRHAMRLSRLDQAIALGLEAVRRHGDGECWAWLGAAWRISGDSRARWFYRDDVVSTLDLRFSAKELERLASFLRGLHHGSTHPLGQSPRGGTQTMGPLLKRAEPEIKALRVRLADAVRRYITHLPPSDRQHPFLGRVKRGFGFAGAWSVLLRQAGHHVPHIHNHGWISSALYIDIPDGMTSDAEERGWLEVGVPPLPEEHGTPPLRNIPPVVGRLVLFPSLYWHGTRPFGDGERLTVAFDVIPR